MLDKLLYNKINIAWNVGSFKHISWNEVFNLFHLTDLYFPDCIQQLVIID